MDYRNGRIGLVYIANQVIIATEEASAPFYKDIFDKDRNCRETS